MSEVATIVRCRSCIHRPHVPENYKDGFDLEFPDNVCPCQCDDGWYSWNPSDRWFCANGEEKEKNIVHGKWEDYELDCWTFAKCSECGTTHDVRTNYCPFCGARMDYNECPPGYNSGFCADYDVDCKECWRDWKREWKENKEKHV